jgi:hypothetical protein
MTGYGFCGPQTAMGTTFAAKSEAIGGAYYAAWQSSVIMASDYCWFFLVILP